LSLSGPGVEPIRSSKSLSEGQVVGCRESTSGSCGGSWFSFILLLALACGYDCVEAETGYSTYGGVHS
jgi:hypothetical protein